MPWSGMHIPGPCPMPIRLFSLRWWRFLLPALLIVYPIGVSRAQAPGVPVVPGVPVAPVVPGAPAAPGAAAPAAPGAPGGAFFRLTYLTFDQWSFVTHPYYQITGDSGYANGHSASGGSAYLTEPKSDAKADFLTKLFHSIPPFGVEWGRGTDLFLPKSASLGFEYFRFSQQDKNAATGGTVLPIVTDTYLYCGVFRLFAFDVTEPGLNYFVGVGLGMLTGSLFADP